VTGAAGVGDVRVGVAKFVESALVAVSDEGAGLRTFPNRISKTSAISEMNTQVKMNQRPEGQRGVFFMPES
jgi:hypothetical protein